MVTSWEMVVFDAKQWVSTDSKGFIPIYERSCGRYGSPREGEVLGSPRLPTRIGSLLKKGLDPKCKPSGDNRRHATMKKQSAKEWK